MTHRFFSPHPSALPKFLPLLSALFFWHLCVELLASASLSSLIAGMNEWLFEGLPCQLPQQATRTFSGLGFEVHQAGLAKKTPSSRLWSFLFVVGYPQPSDY